MAVILKKKNTYLVGIIKCNKAHNSFKLFCNGVPVIKRR